MSSDKSAIINQSSASSLYLIKGDIPGIQDFIFNVKSDGAAQSLKGRSFFIKILLEVGMRLIFDKLGIEKKEEIDNAKISTSGGNFILKVNKDASRIIGEVQKILTQALQFTKLNIMITAVPMQESYQDTLITLNQKTRVQKYQLFENCFDLFAPIPRIQIRNIIDNKKWTVLTHQIRTQSQFKVSEWSDEDVVLQIKTKKQVLDYIQFAGYKIEFGNNFGKEGVQLDKYLEHIFPILRNQTMMFKDLVKSDKMRRKSLVEKFGGLQGVDKLGVLAMDVDNLGAALEGVKKEGDHQKFDTALQHFFNIRIKEIIEQYTYDKKRDGYYFSNPIDKYKNRIYTITAGGDDSYFVGKWNTLLDLAIDIRSAFEEAFKEKNLTISAALVIVDPRFPVVRFAQLADDAIKNAKYDYEDQKGNINLFGEVITWDILIDQIIPLREKFNKFGKSQISSGLLAKARKTATRVAEDKGLRLSDLWKMGYFLRNFEYKDRRKKYEIKGEEIVNQHRKLLEQALSEKNPLKRRSLKMIFPIAARLAEFDNRNK